MPDKVTASTASEDGARKLDPRVVLLQVLLAAACGFCLNSVAASSAAALSIAALLWWLGCRRAAARLLVSALAVNAACALILMGPSWGVASVFLPVFFLARKLVPIAGAALLFWNALSVSRLIAVLTHWRLPRGFVLTLAIAYRFMPTIRHEFAYINDALAMRGRALSLRSVLANPKEMCECVLVPFMMRCTRVADELAVSATARAIESPVPRSSRYELRMGGRDYAALLVTVAAAALVVAIETL